MSTVEAHGLSMPDVAGGTPKKGMKVTIGGSNLTLSKITKKAGCDATTAYLLDSAKSVLASAAFSGNDATFSYPLISGAVYYFVADSGGSTHNYYYRAAGTGLPVAGTYLTWTNGYTGSADDATARLIASVTVDVDTGITLSDDSVNFLVGSKSVKATWTTSGAHSITHVATLGDISAYTGASSGTPVKGTIGLWVYQSSANQLSDLVLKIGSSGSNYKQYSGTLSNPNKTLAADTGWMYVLFDLDNPSGGAGTPVWTSTAYCVISFTAVSASGNASFDYFTISKSNSIGLNGLGNRRDSWTTISTNTY